MRIIRTILCLVAALAVCRAEDNTPPTDELASGLGGIPSVSRSDSLSLNLGSGTPFQANHARRIVDGEKLALYAEINFVASPLRDVSSGLHSGTRNVASLYLTPGIRVKAVPRSRVSPYFAIGGGYADYEQSTTRLDGTAKFRAPGNSLAARLTSGREWTFGCGAGSYCGAKREIFFRRACV